MAIYNGRILMRKGNEADFDASKLMSGEWAVSLDAGIVRICLEAGKVIRMATYEAFEEDMKQIEAILLECKTIEEAVQRINTEINAKVEAVVEYVGQAKAYRDEAKTFRDEAEAFKNQAGEIAGIDIATTEKAGIVKPDGTSITVDADGTIHADTGTIDYTELENKPAINGVELNGNLTTEDLNIVSSGDIVDNLLSTSTKLPLSANQGRVLDEKISTINESVENLADKSSWKFLTRITDAKGKSFSFPTEDWEELKIYVLINGGTNCLLTLSILKDIVAESVQYVSDTIYADDNSFDTAILSFTNKGVSSHNLITGTTSTTGIIVVFYR